MLFNFMQINKCIYINGKAFKDIVNDDVKRWSMFHLKPWKIGNFLPHRMVNTYC